MPIRGTQQARYDCGRPIVAAAMLAALVSAPSATIAKDCKPDLPITDVEFADGSKVHVLERANGELNYESTSPSGKKARVKTVHGMFTLTVESEFDSSEFTWDVDPAKLIPRKVGEKWSGTAVVKSAKGTTQTFGTEVSATGTEQITIGDCAYPVTKIESANKIDDNRTYLTRYFHEPSLLALRTVISIKTSEGATKIISEFKAVDVK